MKYTIREYPDPILRKKAKKVRKFDQNLRKILEGMYSLMKGQKHGIGIAAPQVGISQRIVIIDLSERIKGQERIDMINPRIIKTEGKLASREGCMSVPLYTGQLNRADIVVVEWQNASGEKKTMTVDGIMSRCIQHEIDHLDGKLFLDRVSSMKRDMIPRSKNR